MKPILLLFLLASHLLRADLVIVEELMLGGKVGSKITTSVRKDMARVDYGDQQSAIFDLKGGDYIALIHPHKLYSRTEGKAYLAQLAQAETANPLPLAKPKGKQEWIGDKSCNVLAFRFAGASVRVWAAKDHPSYVKWKTELAALRRLNREPIVDGMILKTETHYLFTRESTRVVSIQEVKLPDSRFLLPAGYKRQAP